MAMDAVAQLRDLRQAHSELQAQLREKDAELKELKELTDASIGLHSQDVQTARIIDLSKKNRALQLSLEKEKQRASKLQADLRAAQSSKPAGLANAAADPGALEHIARGMVERAAEAAEAASRDAAAWKEKCQQQTNKISQLEQKVFLLEIEGKKLTRALVREVGEDVPLAKILDEASADWKGRREQIMALKHQVQSLKAAQGLAAESKHDVAARKVLDKVTGAKSAELEQLKAELATARQEAQAARTKADGALSRRKILEAEVAGLKEKMAVVLTKTQNDDRLVAALRAELAAARRTTTSLPEQPARPPVEQDEELWHELSTLRRRCAEQQAQLARYEGTIQSLNERLQAAHSSPATGLNSSPSAYSQVAGALGRPTSSSSSMSRGSTPLAAAKRPSSGNAGRASAAGCQWEPSPPRPSCGDRQLRPSSSTLARQYSGTVQGVTGGATDLPLTRLHSSPSQGALPAPSHRPSSTMSPSTSQLLQQQHSSHCGADCPGTQAQAQTPVGVRDAAAAQQLKVAEVEISRLQELVQLLSSRVEELEVDQGL